MQAARERNDMPAQQSSWKFAVSKAWLPRSVQADVWKYAFGGTPSAIAMGTVTIEAVGVKRKGLSVLRITTAPGTHRQTYMGRSMINPCSTCEYAEMTGMPGCGRCRSQPRSYRHSFRTGILGGCSDNGDKSPRQQVLSNITRQTCPVCKKLYRNDWDTADFVAEEGCCAACWHSGAL